MKSVPVFLGNVIHKSHKCKRARQAPISPRLSGLQRQVGRTHSVRDLAALGILADIG